MRTTYANHGCDFSLEFYLKVSDRTLQASTNRSDLVEIIWIELFQFLTQFGSPLSEVSGSTLEFKNFPLSVRTFVTI